MWSAARFRTSAGTVLQWTIVCWVIVFWRIDYVGLVDDAAHYAQLTREMLLNGSWLVPLLNGEPFIDKPVLFHWLQGLAFWAFGESELTARLPSAVAAIVLFAVTRQLGHRLMGPAIGHRAWVMVATIPATFVLSRVGYLDMLFTTFLFGSVGCLLMTAVAGRPRAQYVGYALLVAAVMTKGPVALALVGLLALLGWLWGGDCHLALRRLDWRRGVVLVALGSAPWFAWMYFRFGDTFVRDYLLLGHLFYLSPRASASSVAPAFYLQMFVTSFFPWSLVTMGYLVDTIRGWRTGERPPASEIFLWLWIASVILLFTAARFRVDRYVFPAAPACCLLAANAWWGARQETAGRRFAATRVAIFTTALLLAGLAAVIAWRLPDLDLAISVGAFLLPTALALGGLFVALSMLRHSFRPPVVLDVPVGMLLATYAVVVAIGLPLYERARPIKEVGAWLQIESSPGDSVGLYRLDRWQPALRFYGHRPLERLGTEREAQEFIARPGTQWLVTRRESLESLMVATPSAHVAFTLPAVVGTKGSGVRRQVWSDVIVVHKRAASDSIENPLHQDAGASRGSDIVPRLFDR